MDKIVRITKPNGWYSSFIGAEFKVIRETTSSYLLYVNPSNDEFWVDKSDCTILYIPSKTLTVKVKLIPNYDGETVDMPVKLPQGDWIDLRACISVHKLPIKKGEKKCIPLGVAMDFPNDYEAYILPRSSLHKKGLLLMNSQGVIDGKINIL